MTEARPHHIARPAASPPRRCQVCGKKLSVYNSLDICFACDESQPQPYARTRPAPSYQAALPDVSSQVPRHQARLVEDTRKLLPIIDALEWRGSRVYVRCQGRAVWVATIDPRDSTTSAQDLADVIWFHLQRLPRGGSFT